MLHRPPPSLVVRRRPTHTERQTEAPYGRPPLRPFLCRFGCRRAETPLGDGGRLASGSGSGSGKGPREPASGTAMPVAVRAIPQDREFSGQLGSQDTCRSRIDGHAACPHAASRPLPFLTPVRSSPRNSRGRPRCPYAACELRPWGFMRRVGTNARIPNSCSDRPPRPAKPPGQQPAPRARGDACRRRGSGGGGRRTASRVRPSAWALRSLADEGAYRFGPRRWLDSLIGRGAALPLRCWRPSSAGSVRSPTNGSMRLAKGSTSSCGPSA